MFAIKLSTIPKFHIPGHKLHVHYKDYLPVLCPAPVFNMLTGHTIFGTLDEECFVLLHLNIVSLIDGFGNHRSLQLFLWRKTLFSSEFKTILVCELAIYSLMLSGWTLYVVANVISHCLLHLYKTSLSLLYYETTWLFKW